MHAPLRYSVFCCLALAALAPRADAVVLWTDNAEDTSKVISHISGSYTLLQSSVVAQGSSAFHLAHPVAFNDEWFESNAPVTVQADSSLYFLSRLGYAGSAQRAQVHVTTNNGLNWSPALYDQVGTGTSGEGAFALRTVNLSAYAGQSLRFRFYYDFTSGSQYPQTSPGVGWYVDAIHIADQPQKIQYSIGNPSNDAQLYLEYVNRARADAVVEASRLAATSDPQILQAYTQYGITSQSIINDFNNYINSNQIDRFAQPLSFNSKLNTAAQLHTQDMFAKEFQGHNSSSAPPAPFQPGFDLGQRFTAVGYSATQAGENVFSYSKSVPYGHAGFDVDWGNNPAGHRIAIHNGDYKEVGVGVVNGTNGSVGPQLVTQDFATPGAATFVTGVVYQDLNGNNFYDLGEGKPNVRIDVADSAYFAISSASGGYSVPVTGDGAHSVSFTGGGFANFSTTANVLNGDNVKIDYKVTPIVYQADFNGDTKVDAADLAIFNTDFGTTKNGANFLTWQREFGSGVTAAPAGAPVPEPSALVLAALATLAVTFKHRRRVAAGL